MQHLLFIVLETDCIDKRITHVRKFVLTEGMAGKSLDMHVSEQNVEAVDKLFAGDIGSYGPDIWPRDKLL